jgi:F-type H+-transporting ATPase subunit delta
MGTSRALAKEIIATYARALFEAASSEDAVDVVASQLEDVVRTVRGHADLRDALHGTALPAETRAGIAREVFGSLNPVVVATLGLMADRGEFDLLPGVTETYSLVAEENRNVVAVDVTTVVELTDAIRQAITAKLSSDLGKGVVLREKVDPSILGGIVINAGGRTLDASLASQLEAARVTLSTAHTGGDV